MLKPKNGKAFLPLNKSLVDAWGLTGTWSVSGAPADSTGAPLLGDCKSIDGADDDLYKIDTDLQDLFGGGGTLAMWLYLDSADPVGTIARKEQSSGGEGVWTLSSTTLGATGVKIKFTHEVSSYDDGTWTTSDANVFPFDEWHHLAVTWSRSSTGNTPIIYIDAVARSLTQNSSPGGSYKTDSPNYEQWLMKAGSIKGKIGSVVFHTDILPVTDIRRIYHGFHPLRRA